MNQFLTCPDGCGDALNLGAIDTAQDCISYAQKFSQVCGLIILPNEALRPADWTDPESWVKVVDNGAANNTHGRYLVGEGGISAPEEDVEEYPKRLLGVNNRVYTVEFVVYNLSDAQYAFLRQMQCRWLSYTFWIETLGGRILGGAAGIKPIFHTLAFLYNDGREDKEQAVITITYESDGDPERADISGLAAAIEEQRPEIPVDPSGQAVEDPSGNIIVV